MELSYIRQIVSHISQDLYKEIQRKPSGFIKLKKELDRLGAKNADEIIIYLVG